jgi:hypothetical protein
MTEFYCSRCGKPLPPWLPVHPLCLVIRLKYPFLALGALIVVLVLAVPRIFPPTSSIAPSALQLDGGNGIGSVSAEWVTSSPSPRVIATSIVQPSSTRQQPTATRPANSTATSRPIITATISPSPRPTVTSTQQPSTIQEPIDFVIEYWQNVSAGHYQQAWNELSPSFQKDAHKGSYSAYVDGYQKMQVCSIRTSDVRLVEVDSTSAVVTAHMTYRLGAGCRVSEYNFKISLVYDSRNRTWLYNSTVIL